MTDKDLMDGISAYFSKQEKLGKQDLDAYEAVFRRLPGLPLALVSSHMGRLKARFKSQLLRFFTITDVLADYADMMCWCNLNGYYALKECPGPTTEQDLILYLIENQSMFLLIMANYREAEGVDEL